VRKQFPSVSGGKNSDKLFTIHPATGEIWFPNLDNHKSYGPICDERLAKSQANVFALPPLTYLVIPVIIVTVKWRYA
jgi:hypothetical protein